MDSRKKIFFVLFMAIFTSMLGLGIIVPILPAYARSLGANGLWIGIIFAGFSISRSCFMPIVGKLSDKTERKIYLLLGLFIYALSSIGYIYATDSVSLLMVRIIQGMCSAMIVPVAMAYIGDISPKDKEGSYIGLFTVSIFLGFGFGPLLGGVLKDLFFINVDFFAMGVLCAVAFVLVLVYLPSGSKEFRTRVGSIPFKIILKSPQIKAIACYRFINAFGRGAVVTFLPLYASRDLHLSSTKIGIIISSSIFMTSLLQIPFGRLADVYDRKKLVIFGSIVYFFLISLFLFGKTKLNGF